MNRYSQHLTYSLLATLLGLPLGCLAAGLVIGGYGLIAETGDLGQFPKAFGFGLSVAVFAGFIGLLPALLYGAPIYAWLSYKDHANTLSAILIGAVPGVAMLPFEPSFSLFVLLFGVCVSLATHLLVRNRLAGLRHLGANNSFKPRPLRGSA